VRWTKLHKRVSFTKTVRHGASRDWLSFCEKLKLLNRRTINARHLAGFGEGSDYLPERFLKEPATGPGSESQVCELDQMLAEYYEKRGWKNGVVPEEKLKELEIIA
jgi:aldehyde:ferredoxin oxidoreductase